MWCPCKVVIRDGRMVVMQTRRTFKELSDKRPKPKAKPKGGK